MTESNVKRKDKTNFLPWLLVLVGLLVLGLFLGRRDGRSTAQTGDSATTAIASTGIDHSSTADSSASTLRTPAYGDEVWTGINPNAPDLTYNEIHGKGISVRGTDHYAVYDLGEDVLFDHDQSTIRPDAVANLKEVAASIHQRFDKGPVRLYGFTDAQGSKAFNMELARARAEAVKQWLVMNGGISGDRISVEARGQADPKASNDSPTGRQQNRRVQIVVKKAA